MVIAALLLGILVGALGAWLLLRERLAERRRAADELGTTFKALSAEALQQSSSTFLDLARTQFLGLQEKASAELDQRRQAVESMVTPLRESVERVGNEVRALEQARREAYGSLLAQVRSLTELQGELRNETAGLVKALRTPGVRGTWGEMQLRRAVETAGMLAHCDFVEQAMVAGDERVLRPDLLVKLPGGKVVVVDAKAPVEALLAAHDAVDESEQSARMRDYVRHVRDHMTKLSAKAYWQQFAATPDFVVMFLPGESFFRYALEQDPSLLEQGPGKRVILASPTILITMLRAVAVGWREETIAESARQISEQGRVLYERIAPLCDHVAKLGRQLDGAVRSYNEAVGSLEARVLPAARRFPELGVPVKDELPPVTPIERAVKPVSAPELLEAPPPRAVEAA
jgi:DNA recombination protein RmuC